MMTEDSSNSNIAENVKWCSLINTDTKSQIFVHVNSFIFEKLWFCLDLWMFKLIYMIYL
jgi:hypothetical protein